MGRSLHDALRAVWKSGKDAGSDGKRMSRREASEGDLLRGDSRERAVAAERASRCGDRKLEDSIDAREAIRFWEDDEVGGE